HPRRRSAHLLHRREQQPDQHGDDGDDHQQFNQREGAATAHAGSLPVGGPYDDPGNGNTVASANGKRVRWRELDEGGPTMPAVPSLEQFTGCLLGLAVGDGIGAPFEGLAADSIFWGYGSLTELVANRENETLHYTDDTEMMIGVAETLLEDGE